MNFLDIKHIRIPFFACNVLKIYDIDKMLFFIFFRVLKETSVLTDPRVTKVTPVFRDTREAVDLKVPWVPLDHKVFKVLMETKERE